MTRWAGNAAVVVLATLAAFGTAAFAARRAEFRIRDARAAVPSRALADSVMRGRYLVISHDCGGCHGGDTSPASEGWLQGVRSPAQIFQIGACAAKPGAQPCWKTYPRNLTPDALTGLGRFSERQIFNALRYGLRPEDTPDVEITSSKPGVGNFPAQPHYLAPPMPWTAWRYMSDEELFDIAAYLKHGLKPVRNKVPDSEGPPDFWASAWAAPEFGSYPTPVAFPTQNEQAPAAHDR